MILDLVPVSDPLIHMYLPLYLYELSGLFCSSTVQ